jgi:single-strand DNA-binding protein
MAYKNSVILGGNLTKDPEVRTTQGGTTVAEFGLAVTRPAPKGRDNGTDYFTVVSFGKLAEIVAEKKSKGDAVVVEGEVSYSSWEAQDGSKRSRTTIKADDVQFVDTVGNGINRAVLIGNITRNPETRTVETGSESGVPVCNFGLAINRVHSNSEDAVDFVDVDVWRESGEAVQANKTKGEGVMVEGRLQYDAWQAGDGSPRSKVKVVADSVQFTTLKKGQGSSSGSARAHRGSAGGPAKAAHAGRARGGSRDGAGASNGGGNGAPATRAQISRLEREAVAAAGEDGVAKLERRLGKALSDLTRTEASGHIDRFVQAKSVPA